MYSKHQQACNLKFHFSLVLFCQEESLKLLLSLGKYFSLYFYLLQQWEAESKNQLHFLQVLVELCQFLLLYLYQDIKFFNFWWSNRLKENFSFRKMFCPLNFFSICFMLSGFCKHLWYDRVLPVCLYYVTFLKDFFGFFTVYLHNIDEVFIKCASVFLSVANTLFSTRVISLLPIKPL